MSRSSAVSRRLEVTLSVLLAAVGCALVLHHMSGDSATTDEPVHVASAVEIVREGSGRWNPEHPPLAKALAGLALWGLPLRPPEDPLTTTAHAPLLIRFLYENETPPDTILFRARLPFAGLFVLLLFAVRAVAARRFGPTAGCVALAFAALEPNLLAHAGIVHTDIAVTLFLVLSLDPLARLADPWDSRAAPLLGAFWGLAFLSKYDAPLLVLISLPFLLVGPPLRGQLGRVLSRLTFAAVIAMLVTVAGFAVSHRNQTAADRETLAKDRLLLKGRSPGAAALVSSIGAISAPAANAALGALSVVLQSREGAGVNFFLGRVSRSGSLFYFPVALATKISLGLAAAAVVGAAYGRRSRFALASGLALLLFFAVTATSTYNIGVRHALFAFPLAAIVAAGAMPEAGTGPRAFALAGLFLLAGLETVAVHPHELSFFNAAAGGPSGGRRLFVDSNLDWGQDLARLAEAAPRFSSLPLPAVVFGGDLPRRYPTLRPLAPGDEDRAGAVLALGEAPFAVGPELLASKGAVREAERLDRLRRALHSRGERIGSIGGSIGVWKIAKSASATPP